MDQSALYEEDIYAWSQHRRGWPDLRRQLRGAAWLPVLANAEAGRR